MNDILIKITNGDRTLAQACNHLVYPAAYAPGDSITMTVPEPGYYVIRLDDAMNEEFVYMNETSFTLEIPFAEARISYSLPPHMGQCGNAGGSRFCRPQCHRWHHLPRKSRCLPLPKLGHQL